MNELKFDSKGRIKASYNFEGMQIQSLSMTWMPYLKLGSCDEQGRNCKTVSGFLADYMNILAGKYNFTWESHLSLDGNWGTRPASEPANKSGTWKGVFGSVVNGNYDTSMSMWSWIKERSEILDFVELVSSSNVLVLTPQLPEIDVGLFIRPFRNDAWSVIGLLTIAIIGSVLFPYARIRNFESTQGYQVNL